MSFKPIVVVGTDAIVLKMPFHMKAKEELKQKIPFEQRSWVPAEKVWKISTTKHNYDAVVNVLKTHWPGISIPVFSREGDVQATFDTAIDTTSYYTVLSVPEDVSLEDIKRAHRKLVMRLHPDVNSAPDASRHFILVQRAYKTLSNPKRRAKYDRVRKVAYRKKFL